MIPARVGIQKVEDQQRCCLETLLDSGSKLAPYLTVRRRERIIDSEHDTTLLLGRSDEHGRGGTSVQHGAGDGNRTHVSALGGLRSTTELRPRVATTIAQRTGNQYSREGFEGKDNLGL